MLRYIFLLSFLCFFNHQCKKENSIVKKQIPQKIDSLCRYKEFDSKELFIIQHEKKDNKHFIKITTSEYFDADSVSLVLNYKNKVIAYYSPFFNYPEKKVTKKQITTQYASLIYKEGMISIFHPKYAIFELTNNGKMKDVKKNKWSNLFQYDYIRIPEEIK